MPNPRVQAVSRLLHRSNGHKHVAFGENMVKRAKPAVITTEAVDFKPAHTAKTKQSWRYPGGNIVRASDTWINGRQYTDHKDTGQPRRKQESNFFITINSNKAPDDPVYVDACVQRMKDMLKVISQDKMLASYIKFGPKNPEHYGGDRYADVIHSVDWKSNVEVGDQLKRVHCHIWLTISHYSQVQINVHALMALARRHYNGNMQTMQPALFKEIGIEEMPYVHVKLLPQSDWTDVMRQYIHKAMNPV